MELLSKLYTFYSSRYSGTELESKFNAAVEDLILAGDIKQSVYIKYCIDNNIEPTIKKRPTPTYSSGDSCSSGRSFRSTC